MAIIRPRLTDYYGILLSQEEADFAIPFLDEDIPFFVDPFLLWKSPSQQDNALHTALINSFNHIGFLANHGREDEAINQLILASECKEVGLGFAANRSGLRIGKKVASSIIALFTDIPELKIGGFAHMEAIQLFVDQISLDRISDFTCSFLKSFLIDYTIEQCKKHGIPCSEIEIRDIYEQRINTFIQFEIVSLPLNPESLQPILLVPKRWLRKTLWINNDDYEKDYFLENILRANEQKPSKGELLLFNRKNYGITQTYLIQKERSQEDCKNDPLFSPIPVRSAKRKFASIEKLPTGKIENADRKYEDYVCQLMASLMYPHLDFAEAQSRTDSGTLIRDLVFYNNVSYEFLADLKRAYDCRQIVMELKNVQTIERTHINQLNRYLSNEFGRFGIIITRNQLPKALFKNTIDLWSGQRKCIISITDEDLAMMVDIFESKQRMPIEIIKKKYVEFIRACPA